MNFQSHPALTPSSTMAALHGRGCSQVHFLRPPSQLSPFGQLELHHLWAHRPGASLAIEPFQLIPLARLAIDRCETTLFEKGDSLPPASLRPRLNRSSNAGKLLDAFDALRNPREGRSLMLRQTMCSGQPCGGAPTRASWSLRTPGFSNAIGPLWLVGVQKKPIGHQQFPSPRLLPCLLLSLQLNSKYSTALHASSI